MLLVYCHQLKMVIGACLWVSMSQCLSVSMSHLEEEGDSVVPQLAEQLLLDPGVSQLVSVLQLREHLPGHQEQVSPEGHAHHIHVLTAVPKRT